MLHQAPTSYGHNKLQASSNLCGVDAASTWPPHSLQPCQR